MTSVTKCALKRGVNRLMSACKPKHAASEGACVRVFVRVIVSGQAEEGFYSTVIKELEAVGA